MSIWCTEPLSPDDPRLIDPPQGPPGPPDTRCGRVHPCPIHDRAALTASETP